MAMARLTPKEAAEKQVRNLSNSVEDIRRGVDAVTESPMEKAAANVQGYLAGVQRSSAKWQSGLRRVTLAQWKDNFKNVGIPRIAQGAQASQGKVEAFYNDFFPFLDSATAEVRKMPNVTLEDSINRASTMIRKLAAYKRK